MPGIAAAERDKVSIEGLDGPVEILVDQWGIPHIYAGTVHDVFFAQGWNAARERLWQLDLWRKRGLGRLAENFGPQLRRQGPRRAALPLSRRHGRRVGGLWPGREGLDRGVRRRSERLRRQGAGRRGAVAGRVQADRHPARALGRVGRLVRIRSHGISNNAEGESIRMRIVCGRRPRGRPRAPQAGAGPRARAPRRPRSLPTSRPTCWPTTRWPPRTWSFTPPGAAPAEAAAPADAGRGGRRGRLQQLGDRRLAHGHRPADPGQRSAPGAGRALDPLRRPPRGARLQGDGRRRAAPAGRHLGHNDKAAFGITIFPADQADLYVYELNPENPRQYRYDGGWEDMRIVTETHRGEGRGGARGRAGLHPPRSGAEERAGEEPRVRAAHRLVRAGHRRLLRRGALSDRHRLADVPARR